MQFSITSLHLFLTLENHELQLNINELMLLSACVRGLSGGASLTESSRVKWFHRF